MTQERADTGTRPHLDRGQLYRRARRIAERAQIIMDITGAGVAPDLHRAETILNEIAALCGSGEEDGQ
jgi:hypothetical protein